MASDLRATNLLLTKFQRDFFKRTMIKKSIFIREAIDKAIADHNEHNNASKILNQEKKI